MVSSHMSQKQYTSSSIIKTGGVNFCRDIHFATVQTMGQNKYLCSEYFDQDEFDYIIIDGTVQVRLRPMRA